MAGKSKQLGLYVILTDGDYGFLKWNKVLVAFGYRIDVVHLDEFERVYAPLFEMDDAGHGVQDIPISFTDGSRRLRTVYVSRGFKHKIETQYPQYLGLLEKGYVVLMKTFKKLRVPLHDEPRSDEILDYLLKTQQFCKNFRSCLQLTIGDIFKPGGFFGCVMDDHMSVRRRREDQPDLQTKIELAKRGDYFMLEFPR